MMTKTIAAAILAFVSASAALPSHPTPVARSQEVSQAGGFVDEDTPGKAIGGALDLAWQAAKAAGASSQAPAPTAAPSIEARADATAKLANSPDFWTISVVNRFGHPISTNHDLNRSIDLTPFPAPVSGNTGGGVLQDGQSDSIVVPRGWAGRIPVVEYGAGRQIVGDESKIEASYRDQGQYGGYMFDINISYVDGFSLPITCSCDVGVIAGCNNYLWDMGQCKDPNQDNRVGSCKNPTGQRDGTQNWATPFMASCQGAAYTYANDAANSGNGVCGGSTVTCCVGSNCPRNPRQH